MQATDERTGTGALARAIGRARAAAVTPELVLFLASARHREHPYRSYARLRALDPVHRSPLGVWVLSGHAEVAAALRHPALSSDERHADTDLLHLGPLRRVLGRRAEGGGALERGPFFDVALDLLLFVDPPVHTRLRSLVSRAFTPRTVVELEPRIEAIAHGLLDDLVGAGEADLMSAFAYPFPALVICELVGVPAAEVHHVVDHAPALAGGLDPGPLLTRAARDAANRATVALTAYLDELIARRRAEPADDLLSRLLASGDDGGLSHEEVVGVVLLLLIAGHETTANLLGNGLVALLADPDRLAELRADPSLLPAAVDELLRFDSPVQLTMRTATAPYEVAGRTVPAGSIVVLVTGAANHDRTAFEHPDRLDWHRPANPHLAFGGGIHHCLGAALARAEARIALGALLGRLPGLAPAGPPVRRPSFTVRGLSSLPLRWTPPEG